MRAKPPTDAERVVRLINKARREQATKQLATTAFKHNHTRATFGHHYTGRMVQLDLNCAPEQVPYNPGWEPVLQTLEPNFVEKNATRFWVILRFADGHEKVIEQRFKVCCREGKECKRKGCAKCWVAWHLTIPKDVNVFIKEVPSNERSKIVDPAGVDPQGFRPQGKDLDNETRDKYRLTSTQRRYKGEAGSQ